MKKTFEKDYAKYYDLFNRKKNYTKECNFLEEVFKKYGNVKTILDLGCGTGLHSNALASKGYKIFGLDLSEEMIKLAKKRNPNINFRVGDMSNFKLNEKFDAVICMFSSLGYLTENKQIDGFFKSVKKHLKEKGLLIIDCWNGLGVIHELPTSREKTVEIENITIVRKSFPNLKVKDHINKVKFKVKILEKGKLIKEYEEKHKVRFFFPKELKKYIEDVGLKLIKICPSFKLNEELTEKDWNMILIIKN